MGNILGDCKTVWLPTCSNYVVIREQNGEDDDIISNPVKAANLTNLSELISRIVIDTDLTPNKRLTEEQASNLPCNSRYAILMASRINSLGHIMEFDYAWADGTKVRYEQDLNESLFSDYSKSPEESEMIEKPYAIPYYPFGSTHEFFYTLASGKEIKFNLLDGKGESKIVTTPIKTKNLEVIARGLAIKVDDKYETVQNFSMFSSKDMREIRNYMNEADPIYNGCIEVEHPLTHQKELFSILGNPAFFYGAEI